MPVVLTVKRDDGVAYGGIPGMFLSQEIARRLRADPGSSGQLERVEDTIDNLQEYAAKLTEALVLKGILNIEDIQSLLDSHDTDVLEMSVL